MGYIQEAADRALVLQLVHQGQDCTWDAFPFRALLSGLESAGADEPRGPDEPEHEVRFTCRVADFAIKGKPVPGDSITVAGYAYPIARLQIIPTAAHFDLICRQPVGTII